MLFDGASKTVVGCNSDKLVARRTLEHSNLWWVPHAALRWCDRLLKRHGLVPVDVTPSNMIAICGGIGTAKVVQVLDFPAGIVGVNGVMRFLVLEEPMSADGRQQFIPPLTPTTIMRQLGANIRMKDSGDVLEIEDDHGTTHTEKIVRERSGHVHNQLDFFSREKVGNCQTAGALSSSLIRSWLAIAVRNVRMGSTNSRTRNKRSL